MPEAEPLVARWRLRYDPVAAHGVPAHITILFPVEPDVRADRVARAAAGTGPFDYALTRVEEFPGALWLAPDPAVRFVALTRAAMAEFPECPPYGGQYPDITPHLTVAMTNGADLRAEIERDLQSQLPLAARATHLALYVSHDGSWSCRERVPLSSG